MLAEPHLKGLEKIELLRSVNMFKVTTKGKSVQRLRQLCRELFGKHQSEVCDGDFRLYVSKERVSHPEQAFDIIYRVLKHPEDKERRLRNIDRFAEPEVRTVDLSFVMVHEQAVIFADFKSKDGFTLCTRCDVCNDPIPKYELCYCRCDLLIYHLRCWGKRKTANLDHSCDCSQCIKKTDLLAGSKEIKKPDLDGDIELEQPRYRDSDGTAYCQECDRMLLPKDEKEATVYNSWPLSSKLPLAIQDNSSNYIAAVLLLRLLIGLAKLVSEVVWPEQSMIKTLFVPFESMPGLVDSKVFFGIHLTDVSVFMAFREMLMGITPCEKLQSFFKANKTLAVRLLGAETWRRPMRQVTESLADESPAPKFLFFEAETLEGTERIAYKCDGYKPFDKSGVTYDLAAIVEHVGPASEKGDFISYFNLTCRNSENTNSFDGFDRKRWYRLLDTKATLLNIPRDVLPKQPYILLYIKHE